MAGWFAFYRSEMRRCRTSGALKYFFRWKKSFRDGASSVSDRQPWITFRTISILKAFLKREHRVFEYGGGGSSLFFADRVAELVTVEHSREWFATLKTLIPAQTTCKWDGHLVEPQKGDLTGSPDPANPAHYSSADAPSRGLNYKAYVEVIDTFPDNHFDVVLIDGRSRPACLVHAYPKLKPGGLLVLDNSDRDYYLTFTGDLLAKMETIVDEFGPGPYNREFTKTSIWKKR
jgi:SAM-dependent methyltransferase